MNGDSNIHPVKVNHRALVEKVLARYPEEFTVFRELVQNADDAGAENVVIEFQTEKYSRGPSDENSTNGVLSDSVNLNEMKIFKWIIKNDGADFTKIDWDRLTTIADGNPDYQKIGAFGVGFYSVFSVSDCPIVISGGHRKNLFYDGDQLMVQSGGCEYTKGTTIELEVKDEHERIPKPFDLSRFLCTALTFLTKVKRVTVRANGQLLSEIERIRRAPEKIEGLPKELKCKSTSGMMSIESVEMIPQQIRITFRKEAYRAGTNKSRVIKAKNKKDTSNFLGIKSTEANGHSSRSAADRPSTVVVDYTIYSATVSSKPTEDMNRSLVAATKKNPPNSFSCEVVYLDMDEHQRVMQDGNEEDGLGSVFRGPQALCSEESDGHGARLFIGQSTAQTSGIAIHLCSRFIPTVERGSIDLANGSVAKWNAEVLYAGGFLTRLIYERAMMDIREKWSKPDPPKDRLRQEAIYVMKCFTFRPSTPGEKVGELLRSAFFECSSSDSFPILSNLGIRDSKDVRRPNPDFESFMKDCPVLDAALYPTKSTIVEELPKRYDVHEYKFGDVQKELSGRVFNEGEMTACIRWWVRYFQSRADSEEQRRGAWEVIASVGKFHSSSKTSPRNLSEINKFVDLRLFFSSGPDPTNYPLPPDTIPISFTRQLNADTVKDALRWEPLTLVDWIRYLVAPGPDATQDICKDAVFSERVIDILQRSWTSIDPANRATIVSQMQTVPCIPTNRGPQKPQDCYIPEVDLFNELPVVNFSREYLEYGVVLDALGVHKYLDWAVVQARLKEEECSMMRLAAYLAEIRGFMAKEEYDAVKELAIFSYEMGEKRCRIGELYRPDSLHRDLGLPVLAGSDAPTDVGYDTLYYLGLNKFPPLDVIIQKACSEDLAVRTAAWKYFVKHLDDHYEKYDPDDFPDAAFLPYHVKRGSPPKLSTPEKVFTSSEWEIFGFHTIDGSVTNTNRKKLKVKEKPSADAIIRAMREQSLPETPTAKKWFDLLAKKGGFSADKLSEISEMEIVPIPRAKESDATPAPPQYTSPNKCFYEQPDRAKLHHREIFTYVDFKQPANSFLKMCGAKGNPDCADIVNAMFDNPQEYLSKIEAFLEKNGQPKSEAYKTYQDDLRQVAAGYHSLPQDLRARLHTAPIFISFRKRPRASDDPKNRDSREYALKPAREILLPDDLESQQLFEKYIFVAPKEEVFENFYRDHGSKSLSAHVKHVVKPADFVAEAEDNRCYVFERLKIFLHDQDKTRLSPDVNRWKHPNGFTVKYCKRLEIFKSLEFEHITLPDSEPLRPIQQEVLAGIEHAEAKSTLWMKHQSKDNRRDWYDVAVALCRVLFSTHKLHDSLLLMTILDADMKDLRARGYDVDRITEEWEEEMQRANQLQGENNYEVIIPIHPSFLRNWFRDLTKFRKKKKASEEFVHSKMDSMVTEALDMCESDADMKRSLNTDRSKSKGGKKQTDVRYCGSRHMDLERCTIMTKKGMLVFKTHGSEEPPEKELEAFSGILFELGKLFELPPEKLHIFWHQADTEMMGFNRNRAIYLNLAHFKEKHANWASNDNARASMYTAWYFIIAHEIAHNIAFFHDEDHELLFSSIAQHRVVAFKKLLDKRASGATC